MYATTLPRSNWLRRASMRLAWYRHIPASSLDIPNIVDLLYLDILHSVIATIDITFSKTPYLRLTQATRNHARDRSNKMLALRVVRCMRFFDLRTAGWKPAFMPASAIPLRVDYWVLTRDGLYNLWYWLDWGDRSALQWNPTIFFVYVDYIFCQSIIPARSRDYRFVNSGSRDWEKGSGIAIPTP